MYIVSGNLIYVKVTQSLLRQPSLSQPNQLLTYSPASQINSLASLLKSRPYIYIYIYMYTSLSLYIYICVYVQYIYIYIYVIYIYMYNICVYVYIYIYICIIYTHTYMYMYRTALRAARVPLDGREGRRLYMYLLHNL